MQVKGLSLEIPVVSVADTVHLVAGKTLIIVIGEIVRARRGLLTVARYQMDNIGTWESHNVPERVWVAKSEEGKAMQMTLWQSDKPIVAMKSRNWDGAKGLTGRPLEWDTTVRLRNEARLLTKLKSNDLFDRRQRGFSHRAV